VKRWPILSVALEREGDIVLARQRARRIAALLDFDLQDRTRIATAARRSRATPRPMAGAGASSSHSKAGGRPRRCTSG